MKNKSKRKSIFRALFVPLIAVMVLQTMVFYFATIYGGLENTLRQNAVDIQSERMNNRKNELETLFTGKWTDLNDCISELDHKYSLYSLAYGGKPFIEKPQSRIDFLEDNGGLLIRTLRQTGVNGIFLILNDIPDKQSDFTSGENVQKYGLCIRDMDQLNNYTSTEDLLLERAPASIIDTLGCLLDSWWDAKYSFESEEDGAYYYEPLNAAWDKRVRSNTDAAYISGIHRISDADPEMIAYSLPLVDRDGYPYAVLGVELSVKYLMSLIPSAELDDGGSGCYALVSQEEGKDGYELLVSTGTMFSRWFGESDSIKDGSETPEGGFTVRGADKTKIYATKAPLDLYGRNNPFKEHRIVLLAMTDSAALFAYINQIRSLLFTVVLLSLAFGIAAITVVSRRFARPITSLARRVRGMKTENRNDSLGRLGITEIDQLVESIEELNTNVSRNNARTEFFSRMSHDMRTPMNAIISLSSPEMLENADTDTVNEYLSKINNSGMYLLGLINEVLDMTKIESNQTELHTAPVRADVIFSTPVNMIHSLADKKGVALSVDIDVPEELVVTADEQHIKQIVMNLLSNAVKFTPSGGDVRFSVCTTSEGEERFFKIVVADTGIGMSEKFMSTLYTPFSQEGNHEGTGLGLSIAKKLVELMEGTIECKSKQNEGTAFTVMLPLVQTSEPTKQSKKEEEDGMPIVFDGERILVFEDNSINSMIIRTLLERSGLECDIAVNGRIGLDMFIKAKPGTYSAILMDIRMPVMDGLSATRVLRALPGGDAQTIPIIAMTADAFAEDEKSSLDAGMNAHLSKPIETQKLYATLRKYIPKKAGKE